MTDPIFDIQPARPTAARYAEIMSACFGMAPDDRYFAWKYRENPAGEVVAYEATSGGQIAAFYGLIPWYLSVGGQSVRVFQSMDTMTHPKFQRRGLFIRLAQATYSEVEARHSDCALIGIPGSTSLPGFVKKLSWTHVLDSRYIFKPKVFSREPRGLEASVRPVAWGDVALEQYLGARQVGGDRFRVSLDPAFLAWRVFRNQSVSYETLIVETGTEPIGFAAVSKAESGRLFLDLLDCAIADRQVDVINAVTAYLFRIHHASLIYTWKPTEPARSAAFSRAFFFSNPFRRGPFSYRVPFIVRSSAGELNGLPVKAANSYDLQPLVQD